MCTVNEKFDHEGADVSVQSSDGVRFLLHRKNLEVTTGAFPGPEFDTKGEVVELAESSKILELLFVFVYEDEYPDLEEVAFEMPLELAEAVEKYGSGLR